MSKPTKLEDARVFKRARWSLAFKQKCSPHHR